MVLIRIHAGISRYGLGREEGVRVLPLLDEEQMKEQKSEFKSQGFQFRE